MSDDAVRAKRDRIGGADPDPKTVTDDQCRRFWDKVKRPECWHWTGSTCGRYGRFEITPGRKVTAHRLAFILERGPIPEGYTLDHLCRNTTCVNPDHLEVVTEAENIRRGDSPSAIANRRRQCKRGHPMNDTNTYVHPATGRKRCRECARINQAKRYQPRTP